MAAGFQHDDIAWFQFHDFPSALDDADGRLATSDDSQITAGAWRGGFAVKTAAALFSRDRNQLAQRADDAVRLDR
ncbi:hypothetical protein XH92_10170 [Bradyrhizobium sp. CCBAU 53421]|nr:hypothetical protein XH92_10170 [Bradyrhizobium sp. CCBAU 53421]